VSQQDYITSLLHTTSVLGIYLHMVSSSKKEGGRPMDTDTVRNGLDALVVQLLWHSGKNDEPSLSALAVSRSDTWWSGARSTLARTEHLYVDTNE